MHVLYMLANRPHFVGIYKTNLDLEILHLGNAMFNKRFQ